jgi:hypothetical protein
VQTDVPAAEIVISEPMVDIAGFSVELSSDRSVTADERVRLAPGAYAFRTTMLTRDPYDTQCLVSVDDDVLWVSLFITGPGQFDAAVSQFAEAWFRDLWDAVFLAGRPGAEHLQSAPQLLALARACRSMDWGSAVVWAGMTSPRP